MSSILRFPRYLFLLVPFAIVFESRLTLGNAIPDLIWIGLLWGAMKTSPRQAYISAAIISPICDSLAGLPIGLSALGWIPGLWLATYGREPNSPLPRIRWLISALIGSILCEIIVQFAESRTGGNFRDQFLQVGLPTVGYTYLFVIVRSFLPPFGSRS